MVVIASLLGILGTEPSGESWCARTVSLFRYYIRMVLLFRVSPAIMGRCRIRVSLESSAYFRYSLTPTAIIDLVAFLQMLIVPGSYLFLLRVCRLLTDSTSCQAGSLFITVDHLSYAVRERREELLLSFMLAIPILVFSSTTMYLLEGESNPDGFEAYPEHYGGAFHANHCWLWRYLPHTALRRICSGITAIFSAWAYCHANRSPGRGF